MAKMIKVWDQDSPGMKVWVIRNWWQELIYPREFDEVHEKTYTGYPHMKYWGVHKKTTEIIDRTVSPNYSVIVESPTTIYEYFHDRSED